MPSTVHVSLKRSALACLIAAALSLPAFAADDSKGADTAHRSYDARAGMQLTGQRAPSGSQSQALSALRESVPELRYEIDVVSGATRTLSNMNGYLTGPDRSADNAAVALRFVRNHVAELGLGTADLGEYEITDDVQSNASAVRHLYLRQMHQGVPVYNGQLQVHVDREGRVLMVNNGFVPNLAASVNRLQPLVTPEEAVAAAATNLDRAVGPITRNSSEGGSLQRTTLTAAQFSKAPIKAQLMLLPVAAGDTRLVWNFPVESLDGKDWAEFTVDADGGLVGELRVLLGAQAVML